MDEESVVGFLTELTALTKKYDIKVGGCGCCGSPYLTDGIWEDGAVYSVSDSSKSLILAKIEKDADLDGRITANA